MMIDKSSARSSAAEKRAEAYRQGQGRAAEMLADYLEAHSGKILAGYMPMRSEINPLRAMAAHPGPVCVPVITGKDQPLRFQEWTPRTKMVEGMFKALIPEEGDWLTPDVVIVPLLAFDARGYRLGYGGGFYDRTLEKLRKKGPLLAIGFAFSGQEMAAVPTEPTDQKLDLIMTEKGLRRFF